MNRKALSLLLAFVMVFALAVPTAAAENNEVMLISATDDPLSFADAVKTSLSVTVDGKKMKVTQYEDCYVANPTPALAPMGDGYTTASGETVAQGVSIYVPENANKNSAIILCVNNGGWFMDAYSMRTKVENGKAYVSNNDSDNIGHALAKGYVIVSLGCRSRNDKATVDGEYLGHSPATMTDTKALIRYLRYNASALPAGDPEKIVITGTSGGGALSTIIASSGNSSDFFPSLYEVGAAGIQKNADGSYTSTIGDDIFATIAYCPINDLPMASEAYDWTYNETRQAMIDTLGDAANTAFQDALTENYTAQDLMKASAELKAAYSKYVNGLGLKLADGSALTSSNLEAAIIALLEAEIQECLDEGMTAAELNAAAAALPERANNQNYTSQSKGWKEWLNVKTDGSFDFDYDNFLFWLAMNNKLKLAPAFTNVGLGIAGQNEDSLYGDTAHQYCPFGEYAWNNDTAKNGYGLDETGLNWSSYLNTKEGRVLKLQMQMTSPIPYLTSTTNGDSAPYWYVRHGMADRDTSFALQTVLYYALTNDKSIQDVDFEFAWLKPHAGNYDVKEAYAWLDNILNTEDFVCVVSAQNLTVDSKKGDVNKYNINGYNYFQLRDLAALLAGTAYKFDVDFNGDKNEVYITTGTAYTGAVSGLGVDQSASAVHSAWTVYVDGVKVNAKVFNIGGYNYFKLRDLGSAIGFAVDYIAESNTATIATK